MAAIFITVLMTCSVLINKEVVTGFFVVDGDVFSVPDLLVVLEGGDVVFAPTRERVNKVLELYKQRPANILVCAYPEYKKGIKQYLTRNGVKDEHLVQSVYVYKGKKGGGTYNNVLEIMSTFQSNNNINKIEIVTAPYHELRVSLIFSTLNEGDKNHDSIKIRYSHIKNSEVLHTNTPRFLRIISHELLGIIGFYINFLKDKIVELF